MDWDDLPEQPDALAPQPPATPALNQGRGRSDQLEKIRSLEDELLSESLGVVRDAIGFDQLPEDATGPPQEWIEAMGLPAALRRYRRTMAGWRNQKTAPVGIGIAGSFATKVIKARSVERAEPRPLAIVIMPATQQPQRVFEVRDVDD